MQFSALTSALEFASSSQLAFNKGECSQVNFYETYELTDCSTATKLQKCKQCDVLRLTHSTVTLAWIMQDTGCIVIGSGLLSKILHQSVLHNRKSGYYHLPSPKQNSLLCLCMMHWRIILGCYLCVSSIQCIGVYPFIDLND